MRKGVKQLQRRSAIDRSSLYNNPREGSFIASFQSQKNKPSYTPRRQRKKKRAKKWTKFRENSPPPPPHVRMMNIYPSWSSERACNVYIRLVWRAWTLSCWYFLNVAIHTTFFPAKCKAAIFHHHHHRCSLSPPPHFPTFLYRRIFVAKYRKTTKKHCLGFHLKKRPLFSPPFSPILSEDAKEGFEKKNTKKYSGLSGNNLVRKKNSTCTVLV